LGTLPAPEGAYRIIQGTYRIIQATSRDLQGTYNIIQGTFRNVQGKHGIIQGTFRSYLDLAKMPRKVSTNRTLTCVRISVALAYACLLSLILPFY
jgi:hypothetical protein